MGPVEGQGVLSGFLIKRWGLIGAMALVQTTPKLSEWHKMTLSYVHGFYRSGQSIESCL